MVAIYINWYTLCWDDGTVSGEYSYDLLVTFFLAFRSRPTLATTDNIVPNDDPSFPDTDRARILLQSLTHTDDTVKYAACRVFRVAPRTGPDEMREGFDKRVPYGIEEACP